MNISTLKAHLSEAIRLVKAGERIRVMDRQQPVAILGPAAGSGPEISIRPPIRRLKNPPEQRTVLKSDPVALLREDRDAR